MKSAPWLGLGAIPSVAILRFHFASSILSSFLPKEESLQESPEICWNRWTVLSR